MNVAAHFCEFFVNLCHNVSGVGGGRWQIVHAANGMLMTEAHPPDFSLDTAEERLWRGDVALKLTPTAFALLRYLVEHPPATPDQR